MKHPAWILSLSLLPFAILADEEHSLNTITVTAPQQLNSSDAKRSNDEYQFYKSYSRDTVSAERLTQQGSADVVEAISHVPGVTVNSYGAFNKKVTVRGLDGPRVGTVVDGVRIANQGMSHSGAGEINMVDLDSVSEIQVIKGSPSVVYDPGASGGTVSVKTQRASTKKGVGFKQKLGYDDGYNRQQSTTTLEAGSGRLGALIIVSQDKADDYKISGDGRDKQILINNANRDRQIRSNALNVNDLGFDAESVTVRGAAQLSDDIRLDLDWDRWRGKDMNMIHGSTIGQAGIIQYKQMDRDRASVTLAKERLAWFEGVEFKYADQRLYKLGEGSETQLDSQSYIFNSDLPIENLLLKFGGEAVFDQANTLVYSEQDYFAGFVHAEWDWKRWILSGGVRINQWATRQQLLPGTNPQVAAQLLGISGLTPEKTVSNPTWALGAVYQLTDTQNLTFNLNTTFRNPDLYERYAFGSGFIGGGVEMVAESGHHLELAWKYLNPQWAMSASVFYSQFENYIATKMIREITDQSGLNTCIEIGKCDLAKGEFNNKEADFFRQYVKYYNSPDVTNMGAELSARYQTFPHEFEAGASFNKIQSDDVFVQANAQPIKLTSGYKYQFRGSWNPWAKVSAEYVTDYPKVMQTGGFDPYFTADAFAGFKKSGFTFNAGVRNLLNETYRPPYNGINALARSYFVNLTYAWHSNPKE